MSSTNEVSQLINVTRNETAGCDQMVAIVSHDFKNPLCAIQLEAQLLLKISDQHRRHLLAEEVKVKATRILKITERLKTLLTDLLERQKSVEGLASLTKSSQSLAKILQEILDQNLTLMRQKNIQVHTTLNENGPIELDPNKISQVFSNLLSNAMKFTPEGGLIHLCLDEEEDHLVFHIKDSGPGLMPAHRERVFEKYWTSAISGPGTGLGLYICKSIVEAHGGEIHADNTPNGGAHFWFTLPRT